MSSCVTIQYQETHKEKRKRRKHNDGTTVEKEQQSVGVARIQDSALQEMRDEGVLLVWCCPNLSESFCQ